MPALGGALLWFGPDEGEGIRGEPRPKVPVFCPNCDRRLRFAAWWTGESSGWPSWRCDGWMSDSPVMRFLLARMSFYRGRCYTFEMPEYTSDRLCSPLFDPYESRLWSGNGIAIHSHRSETHEIKR